MARSAGKSGIQFGYKLMSETTGPRELVRNAKLAEDAGFDFVALSDHYLPWLPKMRPRRSGKTAGTAPTGA